MEVSDELNRPITGSTKRENFKLFDDKVEQKITSFAMEDDPIALALSFDVSGSMKRTVEQTVPQRAIFRKTAKLETRIRSGNAVQRGAVNGALIDNVSNIRMTVLWRVQGGSTALPNGIYLG